MLHMAAKESVTIHSGTFPSSTEELEKFPGIGPYTARAIAAFSFNQDVFVIETNIRTVIIKHFFPKKKKVSDVEIEKILRQVLPKGRAREWYSALMDYGSYLKHSGVSHTTRSRHYVKQSKFTGSLREVRGAILRLLTERSASGARLLKLFDASRRAQIQKALDALLAEGLIREENRQYSLAD